MKSSIIATVFFLLAARPGAAIPTPYEPPALIAKSAASTYPAVPLLGRSIEGVSVDASGTIYAVNKTHFASLSDATISKPLLIGKGGENSTYSSSRFTRTLGALLGDASAHQVLKVSGQVGVPLFTEPRMDQPNDMAISRDEKFIYFSGMNYSANAGDLWVFDVAKGATTQVALPTGVIFRTNGIELSPDDKTLYLSSGENGAKEQAGAKIFKFPIDATTRLPGTPELAIDLYQDHPLSLGADAKKGGADPDGMRMDTHGNLFITLNAFGRVVKFDTTKPASQAQIIKLETVQFPSNLELGGKDGKTLVVVGRCLGDKESCVDVFQNEFPGRAWTNLQVEAPPTCA